MEQRIEAWNAARDWAWVLELKATGALLGGLGVERNQHEVTLGYVLARPYWGQGLIPEAARAVAFRAVDAVDVHRVCARCDLGNEASAGPIPGCADPSARLSEQLSVSNQSLNREFLKQ